MRFTPALRFCGCTVAHVFTRVCGCGCVGSAARTAVAVCTHAVARCTAFAVAARCLPLPRFTVAAVPHGLGYAWFWFTHAHTVLRSTYHSGFVSSIIQFSSTSSVLPVLVWFCTVRGCVVHVHAHLPPRFTHTTHTVTTCGCGWFTTCVLHGYATLYVAVYTPLPPYHGSAVTVCWLRLPRFGLPHVPHARGSPVLHALVTYTLRGCHGSAVGYGYGYGWLPHTPPPHTRLPGYAFYVPVTFTAVWLVYIRFTFPVCGYVAVTRCWLRLRARLLRLVTGCTLVGLRSRLPVTFTARTYGWLHRFAHGWLRYHLRSAVRTTTRLRTTTFTFTHVYAFVTVHYRTAVLPVIVRFYPAVTFVLPYTVTRLPVPVTRSRLFLRVRWLRLRSVDSVTVATARSARLQFTRYRCVLPGCWLLHLRSYTVYGYVLRCTVVAGYIYIYRFCLRLRWLILPPCLLPTLRFVCGWLVAVCTVALLVALRTYAFTPRYARCSWLPATRVHVWLVVTRLVYTLRHWLPVLHVFCVYTVRLHALPFWFAVAVGYYRSVYVCTRFWFTLHLHVHFWFPVVLVTVDSRFTFRSLRLRSSPLRSGSAVVPARTTTFARVYARCRFGCRMRLPAVTTPFTHAFYLPSSYVAVAHCCGLLQLPFVILFGLVLPLDSTPLLRRLPHLPRGYLWLLRFAIPTTVRLPPDAYYGWLPHVYAVVTHRIYHRFCRYLLYGWLPCYRLQCAAVLPLVGLRIYGYGSYTPLPPFFTLLLRSIPLPRFTCRFCHHHTRLPHILRFACGWLRLV